MHIVIENEYRVRLDLAKVLSRSIELSPISVWWPVGFERCCLEDLRQNTGYRMIKLMQTEEYGNKQGLILCKLTDSGGRLMLGLD